MSNIKKIKKCRNCSNDFVPKVYYHVVCDECFTKCDYCLDNYVYDGNNSSKYCNKCVCNVFKCINCKTLYKNELMYKKSCICTNCTDKITDICIACDDKYINTEISNKKCKKCLRRYKIECNVCNDIYWSFTDYNHQYSKNEAMNKHNINYCDKCYNLMNKITKGGLSTGKINELIDDNYNVEITFIKDIPYHDGYCSDPGEIIRTKSYITKKYPYYKNYPITNIDKYGQIDDVYEGNILLYHKINKECNLGSGYCYEYTKYTIYDARLEKIK